MGIRQDQCNKVCRIIDDYLANRPRERDELIVAVRTVFKEADRKTEPQYDIDKGTIKCDNCSENGSYKCSKCDGEMYFKRLDVEDEPQTEVKVEPTWVGATYGRFEDKPHTERSE